MDSRKTFVIIDMDSNRSEKTMFQLKKANAKVRLAKTKNEIDEVYRTGGIIAILIAPNVVGDVERLKEFYKAPIFVIGNVEKEYLPRLYQAGIVDIFPPDFNIGLLFEKLGEEFVEPFNIPQRQKSSVFQPFDPIIEDEMPSQKNVRKDKGTGNSSVKVNRTAETSKKGFLSFLNQPIGKKN